MITKEKVFKTKMIPHNSLDPKKKFLQALSLIKSKFSSEDRKNLLKGMLLTRATDNALKQLFLSGEMTYLGKGFQGKGFRSLGQEAIFGAGYLLKRGDFGSDYQGDVVAPLIRDLGVFLCFSDKDVETAINAQVGKEGAPCQGRDLHVGDLKKGILTPAAPLAIATCSLVGLAMSFKLKGEERVGISFIGEGGSSLGEWHEAINLAAVEKLPLIFCIENNQTALSTPVKQQSRVLSFADKALGYGMPSLVLDGTDVEELAAGFKAAADYSRAGHGPVLVEVVSMRMCGHAHHDDMLYLGHDPKMSFELPELKKGGYANETLYELWRKKDPIATYKNKLVASGIIDRRDYLTFESEAVKKVSEAVLAIKERAWPNFGTADDEELVYQRPYRFALPKTKASSHYSFSPKGTTYLQAIGDATGALFQKWPTCFVIGEDVAPPYGNAFMMFKNIMEHHPTRFLNTPISENAIVGACIGMALGGMRPIGEIQFNDFVACAMNQVANNAAKHYFRTGLNVPMVLRMPYGGLRRAGPFHSQDTAAWFYRCQGLKIFAPSTPIDAYFMLLKAVEDPDPVLFYEHIALYRDPKIKQLIPEHLADLEGAALVREGSDLSIITYGAYVHIAYQAALLLYEKYQINAEIIDLRYLKPIDFATCHASIKKTSRAILVSEDAACGSIVQSLAGSLSADLFHHLDAPIAVLGSRDLPVPYAPSLEDDYLVNEANIIEKARELMAY